MANKRAQPEEIVTKLQLVEVLPGQGMSELDAVRQIGVTEEMFFRSKKRCGRMGADQLQDLKRLQKENGRLRKAMSNLTLDRLILTEAAQGNFFVLLIIVRALIVFAVSYVSRSAALVTF